MVHPPPPRDLHSHHLPVKLDRAFEVPHPDSRVEVLREKSPFPNGRHPVLTVMAEGASDQVSLGPPQVTQHSTDSYTSGRRHACPEAKLFSRQPLGEGAMSEVATLRPEGKRKAATPRSPKDSVIDVRHLVKVYGGRGQEEIKAVNDVSFTVGEGEFFGFLGPNGAGKTTVIRIITTLLAKTSGSVHVAGLDVERDGLDIRRMIGYTGQSIGVDGGLTGRENLWLIGRLYHMPNSLVEQRVEELLEVLQLKDAADRRAYTYSGGMRRRLDLGAGLVHHPRVLFLDEPTTGLDPQEPVAGGGYLRRLHREATMTIFLTTQYMEEADQLCQRIAIIDLGKIVAEGSPAQLKAAIGADIITVRAARDEAFEQSRSRRLEIARTSPGGR